MLMLLNVVFQHQLQPAPLGGQLQLSRFLQKQRNAKRFFQCTDYETNSVLHAEIGRRAQ